jgi:predicted kinase
MTKLVIIRGLPGSGKTTLAKTMTAYVHVETDMYFVNGEGVYQFDASRLPQAHDWCHHKCALELEKGNNVVVSNTFTRLWEFKPYIEMAKKLNCDYEVIECHGNYQNVHGVPEYAVERMRQRWEKYDDCKSPC